jgi:signal transduction histidine kinase
MDWLDELLEKFKTKVNNLTMKKALAVYIIICIGIVAVITAITQAICMSWDNYIWGHYVGEDLKSAGEFTIYSYDTTKLNRMDRVLVEVIDFLQTWSTFLYAMIGIIGTSSLFYKYKLKAPLGILKEATEKVAFNDLDLDLYYENKDEMGDLCRSFDLMRKKLIENNQKMWDMMEEQKRLNAAFAHDLRTPLTVLRGYTDLLNQYVPEGRISEDKLLSTLSMMSDQIIRLENYSNTMKEINSLEELSLKCQTISVMILEKKLRDIAEALNGKNGIHIKLLNAVFDQNTELSLDESMLLEVYENLMSNALRFAAAVIEVILSLSEDGKYLLLSVSDDGKGFTKNDLFMATKPYYSDNKEQKSEHFGIGLYICKLLCEKHQGWITLGNRMKKGASITAAFFIGAKE